MTKSSRVSSKPCFLTWSWHRVGNRKSLESNKDDIIILNFKSVDTLFMKTEKFKEENERVKGQRNFLALVFCKFDSKKDEKFKSNIRVDYGN